MKDNKQDSLQEIKQNTETGGTPNSKEQDSDIGFLQEEIKKRTSPLWRQFSER